MESLDTLHKLWLYNCDTSDGMQIRVSCDLQKITKLPNCKVTITYVFLTNSALLAVVSIRYTRAPTNGAPSLVWPVITLITNTYQSTGPHIGITHNTLAVTYSGPEEEIWYSLLKSFFFAKLIYSFLWSTEYITLGMRIHATLPR